MIEKLKPCPFCGWTPRLTTAAEIDYMDEGDPDYRDASETYAVCCEFNNGGCGATGCYYGKYQGGAEKAVAAWNRRVTDETD